MKSLRISCQLFYTTPSGIYGYPKDQALKVAIDTISDFLLENDMTVYIVIFDRKAYQISEKLFSDIAAYIDDTYVDAHTDSRASQLRRMQMLSEEAICGAPMAASTKSLDDALSQIDESFSEMLLRKIDEKGMTDAQCYKKQTSTASSSRRSAATGCISRQSPRRLPLRLPWSFRWMKRKKCS